MTRDFRKRLGFRPEPDSPPDLGWPAGHFYSPLPDLEDVRRRESSLFPPAYRAVPGIDIDLARQLVGMIRWLRPYRIVEIGSGFSSSALLDTNQRFFSNRIDCTFIDPNPELLIAQMFPDDQDRVRILAEKVYDVGTDIFPMLEAGDVLFIDSSHVSKIGSDVNDIFYRILPALNPGVYIHFHDLRHDFEYPREWVFQGRAWNEAYLLRAFLQYNQVFQVEFFNPYAWEFLTEEFKTLLPLAALSHGMSIRLRKSA
jgi:hypothetical protein